MNSKLLSPKNDYVFHRLFGDKKNKRVLISLLSAILETNIKNVSYQSSTLEKERIEDKGCILDVLVLTDDNIQINVEMQVVFRKEYISRILLYWGRLYAQQIKIGNKHSILHKTVSITILSDESYFFPDFHSVYGIYTKNGTPPHQLTDLFEMHFIDMDRVSEGTANKLLKLWISFIKEENPEVMKMLSAQNKCVGEAYKIIEELSKSKEEWLAAVARENFWLDQLIREETALREGREEGKKEGREEGKKEGREEGEKIGIKKGEEIGLKKGKIETARAMLSEGFAIETICKITGLEIRDFKGE